MLRSQVSDNNWTLSVNDLPFIIHTPETPFAFAVHREKTYESDRGTVKEHVTETERVPLAEAVEENGMVSLSGGGHVLGIRVTDCGDGAELSFFGEEGWAYCFTMAALKSEAVFGGGEQYRQTNLRGERVVNFVSEHIKAATILEKALLPRFLYREKPHSAIGTYAPMPIFVTDRGRFFLFDTEADGISDFGEEGYSFTFDSCPRKLTLLQKGSYEALALEIAARIPNRQYLPGWCQDGMILSIQGGTEAILSKTFHMLDAGARISGVWSQDWSGENRTVMGKQVWWNWEADENLYPDLRGAIRKLRDRGVRFLGYINPYLVKDSRLYTYCRERGWLITRSDGSIYHIKSTTFDAGMLDLTDPEAVRFIKDVLIKQNMLDMGMSGWMADFGEYLPVDAVLHDGDPKKLHNMWPVLWAKVNREAVEEYGADDVMFFMRSGYLGIQTYAPVLWNGDQHTDITRDYGMPCVMPASFSLGFSGVSMVHCDIGGFFSFGKLKRDDELFIRWMEMGAFSLLMRSHESIRPWANSQFDAPEVIPYTVRLTRIHAALRPYIDRCIEDAGRGIPAIRPDFYEAMDYGASRDMYNYFLGPDLFVCPVIDRHVKERRVSLPEGSWMNFWTGKPCEGGRSFTVEAPLGKLPVFYREGSVYSELFRKAAEIR